VFVLCISNECLSSECVVSGLVALWGGRVVRIDVMSFMGSELMRKELDDAYTSYMCDGWR
jgi:hypothetical protein